MDRLVDAADVLNTLTGSVAWQRPAKTQTATQWTFIARISLGVLEALKLDPSAASSVLVDRFGYSPIPGLQAIASDERA